MPFLRYCSGTFARPSWAVFHGIPKVRGAVHCLHLVQARPWLPGLSPISRTLEGLRACSHKPDLYSYPRLCGAALCQRTSFRKSRKNSGRLSRLRTQPVPLWAFLNFRGQRYGECLILPNISATFFKQIFKLSFKTLKIKQLQTQKSFGKFAELRERE